MTARLVTLEGGSPWGFRIYGGVDVQQPLKIYRVNPGSKAAIKGIREGDIITSINEESTRDATNSEAHTMLKNAGDTLKLGLNEDCTTSPKKRQYRTVQHETHTETVKRSNKTSTSYVINTTKSQTQIQSNVKKNGVDNTNGNGDDIHVNGDSKGHQGLECLSEKSTISSNYSSPASTPSTLTEEQGSEQTQSSIEVEGLNTMEKTSRSKRRKNARKKASNKCVVTNSVKEELNTTNCAEKIEEIVEENKDVAKVKEVDEYRVESPKPQAKTVRKSSPMTKSRSLDDDEAIRIQELSESSENETQNENTAVISEADSDLDWELTTDLKVTPLDKQNLKLMDIQSLELEEIPKERISTEDESNLRQFLQGLDLSSSSDDTFKEKQTSEGIRTKRLQKREELSQYFLPVYQNPRFLDAISEESSDLSDKEQKDAKKLKNKKFFKPNPSQIKKAVILDRDDVETPIISDTCTTSIAESSSGVEVVFLDDDSDDYNDLEDDDEEQRILQNQLTPPPSPDQLEEEEEPPELAAHHLSALTPSISSKSSDRGDSSSRGTSMCTTIFKEDQPATLRELCLQTLVSLPFGEDVLEELAVVSKSLEELTNNTCTKTDSKDSFDLPVLSKPEEMKVIPEEEEESESLSPNQKRYSDSMTPTEGEVLLDLHQKFIDKRNGQPETSATLPRGAPNPRLQAKSLTEWLQLAKDKSKSETHLNLWEPAPKPMRNTTEKRRKSLPHEFYVQQMQYLIQKEKEIQLELERLEEEKRRLNNEMTTTPKFDPSQYHISKNEDIAIHTDELPKFTTPQTEIFRKQMYDEYMRQVAERQERKQHKVIKISSHQHLQPETKEDGHRVAQAIEDEFMSQVKLRKSKYGLKSEDSVDGGVEKSDGDDSEVIVMDGKDLSQPKKLPKHLKEFLDITRQAAESIEEPKEDHEDGIWTPGQRASFSSEDTQRQSFQEFDRAEDPIPPIWTPKSAGSSPQPERKEFKPLNFSSPVLERKNKGSVGAGQAQPPWRSTENASDVRTSFTATLQKRLPNSHSAPASGFADLSSTPRLPKAQNPTIILLQKAREGQLPKGASYIEDPPPVPRKHDSPPRRNPGEIVYEIKRDYTSEPEGENPRRVVNIGPRRFSGVGPTTQDGMPLTLRSEVRDQNQSKWYKRMYDTIHKQKPRYDDDYVTLRYKQRRGRYPYNSGYLSEPEPGAYDSDASMYDPRSATTLDRRRMLPSSTDTVTTTYTIPRSTTNSHSGIIKHGRDAYKNQPGRIENYRPGHSSISEKEAKAWWDEVMDIFDGYSCDIEKLDRDVHHQNFNFTQHRETARNHLEQQKHIPSKGYMSQALKEGGYESDSTLVFRRREEAASQLSPSQQREAYKTIQKGGDVPLHGLRKLAPERPKEAVGIEYMPISPTLTRIRVHRSSPTRHETLVYPAKVQHDPNVFATFKRTAPSTIPKAPVLPPSPPKRKSSRNNSTLRLISTMHVRGDRPSCRRHETCFTSTSNKSNVKYLRDKITCKLSPVPKKKGESRLRVTKTISTTPELRSKISSTLTTSKDARTSNSRVYSKTNISEGNLTRSSSTNSLTKKVPRSSSSTPTKKAPKETRTTSLDRTFGTEKRKLDATVTKTVPERKLVKSPDLASPTEVKRVSQSSKIKKTPSTKDLPVKISITNKGRELLKSPKSRSASPAFSSTSSRFSPSLESLRSIKKTPSRECVLRKSKKDQLNDEIAKKEKKVVKNKPIKCAGKAQGAEIAKKLKTLETISLEDIKKQKSNIETDSFFQNLFLRDAPIQKSASFAHSSWISEKTKALERRRSSVSEPSIGALKIYLNHTKPVSDSKFKAMDVRSRSASPKFVRWQDDKLKPERSLSLPTKFRRPLSPIIRRRLDTNLNRTTIIRPRSPTKLVFTETSRPVSPVIQYTRRPEVPKTRTPERLIFTQTVRPVSPVVYRSRSSSPKNLPPSRKASRSTTPEVLYFSQTTRPVSPMYSSTQSINTMEVRSPSYRKIQAKQGDTIEFLKKKIARSKSASAADERHYPMDEFLTQSTSSIDSCDRRDYQTYVKDMVSSTRKSERFKELNKFYSTIERLGQLEKTTSSVDLRPRRKHEDEIIDYDRWKEVRVMERAEKEMKDIYKDLKEAQRDKDLLFLPKDVQKYRWKKDFDRGLRIKEKSVENIKEEFRRLEEKPIPSDFQYTKDVYKPLWRGNSVVNLAQSMVEKRSQSEGRPTSLKQKKIDSERLLTHGIGSRIWSSLSMEQVNILKNQLAEIYQNGLNKKAQVSEYIEVPDGKPLGHFGNLTVRRNSDSYKAKEEVLSEVDKRKISQSLSQEVLEKTRQKYKTSLSLVLAKETRGATAAKEAKIKPPASPRTCYSLEITDDDKKPKDDLLLVLTKEETEPKPALIKTDAINIKMPSASETDSTDESTRTVILSDVKDVKKKVEYFEKALDKDEYTPTIHKPADLPEDLEEIKPPVRKFHSSSYEDLKEIFGEVESAKSASPKLFFRSPGSYRTRSLSPHPELYYFSLLKAGDVTKLKNRFDQIRRSNSDSQIDRKGQIMIPGQRNGEVDNLRRRYEYPNIAGRGRSRTRRGGVVSPICLKAEDRYMPHINIISKIATLYPRKSVDRDDKQKSTEELAEILGIPIGEVEKLKKKYDAPDRMSLLGHMFTSSPNLYELKDLSPYLAASWAAHRYPKQEDNTRSLSSPEKSRSSMDTSKVLRDKKPKTKSTRLDSVKLSSILKPELKKDEATSSKVHGVDHKPKNLSQGSSARGQAQRYTSRTPQTFSKPIVQFKEPEVPIPPPKGYPRRPMEPESPRKYVENDVTIHFKTPVRQEVKESLSEEELQRRQAEHMKKVYLEERRRKYLQELQDMTSRRHTDNFIPSQKSPIPLNRYDDFLDDFSPKLKPRPRSPEPRLVAKALYNFVGQSARELTFRKGDIIYIRRQIDKNWYEGEFNAMVGLFPSNYVEIVPYDGMKSTVRKPHEGQARAKYNFIAQTHLELSLAKGELVVITRKVDDNWFEGKIGGRKGIFPVSYVDILIDPSDPPVVIEQSKPVASPAAHSLLVNGSLGGKESMGAHNYVPPVQRTESSQSYHAKPVQMTGNGTYGSLSRRNPLNQELHVDTQSEYVPYRAMYKYQPQNEDEIELLEGDTVFVLEKCDDGWFVGSSERTGALGTFPGNYVERIQ